MGFAISKLVTGAAFFSPPRAQVCQRLGAITDCALIILLMAGVGTVCGLQINNWTIIAIAGGSAAGVLIAADLLALLFSKCCGQQRQAGSFVEDSSFSYLEPSYIPSDRDSPLVDHRLIVTQAKTLTEASVVSNQIAQKIPSAFATVEEARATVQDLLDSSLAYFYKATGNNFDAENRYKLALEEFLADSNCTDLSSIIQDCCSYCADFRGDLIGRLRMPIDEILFRLKRKYDLLYYPPRKEPKKHADIVANELLGRGALVVLRANSIGEDDRIKFVKKLPPESEADSEEGMRVSGPKGILEVLESDGPQSTLADEYTIYFSPKWDHFYAAAEELFQFVSEDPSLKRAILSFDFAITHQQGEQGSNLCPEIVLRCLDKPAAQNVLNRLFESFKLRAWRWGSGQFRTCTFRGQNPLISYEQGTHQYKISLWNSNQGLFKKLYDETGAHYNPLFGDYVLELPEGF